MVGGKDMERKCKICGIELPDSFVDNLCDGCWEVWHRFEGFIQHEKGRKFVEDILNDYNK